MSFRKRLLGTAIEALSFGRKYAEVDPAMAIHTLDIESRIRLWFNINSYDAALNVSDVKLAESLLKFIDTGKNEKPMAENIAPDQVLL